MKDENRIFLCHAMEDKQQVLSIYKKLKVSGLNPWLDKKDLLPGQRWDREIRRALKKSRFVIIFFSKYSTSKQGYVQREFKLALNTLEEMPEDKIFIIPVRLDDCQIPETFQHIHYVDLFDPEGFELVQKVIETEIGGMRFDNNKETRLEIIKELERASLLYDNSNYKEAFPIYYHYRNSAFFTEEAQSRLGFMYY
ncbi:MAG: toll/interleukin-1 receptor domain-containing protein [Phaeodactylibacter sp.]|nr:toll/interleukin-1 receptor domain-containing protein [Phaeodactylibacter sp.]